MQLTIGHKIRELRHITEKTQEALAEALGVTSQAVSRWESNVGYPDIEMIPAIANYFHISIDELFGYSSEREERIKLIIEKADKTLLVNRSTAMKSEELLECAKILRSASSEFPDETKILERLAKALFMLGWQTHGAKSKIVNETDIITDDIEYNSQNQFWQEALEVNERILKSNPSTEERETAIYQLMMYYSKMGKYEKALKLANEQNSVNVCREKMLPLASTGERKAQYQSSSIIALLRALSNAISEAVASKPSVYTSEYGIQVLNAVLNLYETIFIDGRCGYWHWDIGHQYMRLAHYESNQLGNIQKALCYFDKGFEHCKKYEKIYQNDEYIYTAPLVSSLNYLEKDKIPVVSNDFWKEEIKHFPEILRNELYHNPKYAECFE